MKAAFCTAPGQFELREVARPRPEPGEALIKIRNCGVCGSDLHWYHGNFPPPLVCPGHEISGEVLEVNGDDGSGLRPGDRVAVEPVIVCHQCSYCRTGDYQLCRTFRLLGTAVDGGFAEYLAMPTSALFRLPPELDWELGAMTEPMAVGVHGVRLANVRLGDRVLILGAGTIGLLSILAARAAGAAEVLITARYPHQQMAAAALGAQVFEASPEGEASLGAHCQDNGIDAIVETVGGAADTLNQAVMLIRPGGTIAVLGVFSAPVSVSALLLVLKEVRLVGSLTYGRFGARADFDVSIGLLLRYRELLRSLITHRVPLDRIGDGFASAADKKSRAIKVTITS